MKWKKHLGIFVRKIRLYRKNRNWDDQNLLYETRLSIRRRYLQYRNMVIYLFKRLVKKASRNAIREINRQRPLLIRSNPRRVVSCFSFLLKLHLA